MTQEEATLAEIKKHIAALPSDERIQVEVIARTVRNIVQHGGSHAALAFALVGAEMAAAE